MMLLAQRPLGILLPAIYFIWSLRYGKLAGPNPWQAVGLEWMTTSPPPTTNFDEMPIVTWEAYEYSRYAEQEAEHDRRIGMATGEAMEEEEDNDRALSQSAPPVGGGSQR